MLSSVEYWGCLDSKECDWSVDHRWKQAADPSAWTVGVVGSTVVGRVKVDRAFDRAFGDRAAGDRAAGDRAVDGRVVDDRAFGVQEAVFVVDRVTVDPASIGRVDSLPARFDRLVFVGYRQRVARPVALAQVVVESVFVTSVGWPSCCGQPGYLANC